MIIIQETASLKYLYSDVVSLFYHCVVGLHVFLIQSK